MRALLAVLLLLTLAFAGCASKEKGGDDDPGTTGTGTATSGTGTSSSSVNGTGSPTDNRAPSISITLSGNQSANGSAPLSLIFVLNGTDADGDALAWTLAFADGSANATGASLPAQQNHTFTAEGTYNVVFNVTDGKTSINATYAIVVGATPTTNLPPIVITGSWSLGAPQGNYYEFGNCEAGPGDETTTAAFDIPAEAAGRSFVATITSGEGPIVSWKVSLSNLACGTGDDEYEDFTTDGSGPITGEILEGWVFGSFQASGGSDLEATLTIT